MRRLAARVAQRLDEWLAIPANANRLLWAFVVLVAVYLVLEFQRSGGK